MDLLETYLWLIPFLLVPLSVFVERYIVDRKIYLTNRDSYIYILQFFVLLSNLYFSFYLLMPLVKMVMPYEVLSISELAIPKPIILLLSFMLIDLVHYLSHRIHHKIPLLWKLHRLHHSDKTFDSMTVFLNHPMEFFTGSIILTAFFVLFDIPVKGMVIYGIIFAVHTIFEHTKLIIPTTANRYLSYVFVTPNLHRVHHSLDYEESNRNFGIVFSLWDRLFSTFTEKTNKSLTSMNFGIEQKQTPDKLNLKGMLINPFI